MKRKAPKYYRLACFVFVILSVFSGANVFGDSEECNLKAGEVNQRSFVGPMIIIFPNGYDNSMWADSKDGKKPAETNVVNELVKHFDETYRTQAQRDNRIIQGFSMGGYGACLLAVKYPDVLRTCINYDGALHNAESLSSRRKPIWKEIFVNDEDYYNQYSPWDIVRKNADAIWDKIGFRMVVGSIQKPNKQLRDLLNELDIEASYVQAEREHDLDCLIGNHWDETFDFIAEHLSQM
jgi:S-formylglutathione hydrolase FrmB